MEKFYFCPPDPRNKKTVEFVNCYNNGRNGIIAYLEKDKNEKKVFYFTLYKTNVSCQGCNNCRVFKNNGHKNLP